MAPSPRPENQTTSRSRGTLLTEIERCWKDALSSIHEDSPESAIDRIDQASRLLVELDNLSSTPATPDEVDRLHALERLHRELLTQSKSAQDQISRDLADARKGTRSLRGYASGISNATLSEVC